MAHCDKGHQPMVWDDRQGKDCPACSAATAAIKEFSRKLKTLAKTIGRNLGPLDISLAEKEALGGGK